VWWCCINFLKPSGHCTARCVHVFNVILKISWSFLYTALTVWSFWRRHGVLCDVGTESLIKYRLILVFVKLNKLWFTTWYIMNTVTNARWMLVNRWRFLTVNCNQLWPCVEGLRKIIQNFSVIKASAETWTTNFPNISATLLLCSLSYSVWFVLYGNYD
jgi:hypothetical protein